MASSNNSSGESGIKSGDKNCPKDSTYPEWAAITQDVNPFSWQFHLPVENISKFTCQKNTPYTNPGGLLSRCGGDLDRYVDALLPPPDDTLTVTAPADTTLLATDPNTNTGAHSSLTLRSRGGSDIVVQFDDERIQRFWENGDLTSAILRIGAAGPTSVRPLKIVPLFDGFVEGGGAGSGATWNCAEDADVTDDSEDCLQPWEPSLLTGDARRPDYIERRAGLLGWDVIDDLRDGVHAWRIRIPFGGRHIRSTWQPAHEGDGKRPYLGREIVYLSSEGALELRQPHRGPSLLLER